jgi:hypothetical protein
LQSGGKHHTPSDVDRKGNGAITDACNNNSTLYNSSRNKQTSFKLSVTLWVYGTKSQAEALVDSGATTNFINKSFVKNNNLITNKLARPYQVTNADGTSNKAGQINEYVRAYIEIGSHKSTHYLFVTDLGDKDMMIGYT